MRLSYSCPVAELYDSPILLWDAREGTTQKMNTHLENNLPDDIFEVRVPIRLCYLGGNHYDAITKDEDRERLKKLTGTRKGAKARIIRKHRRAKISDFDEHPLIGFSTGGGGGEKGRGYQAARRNALRLTPSFQSVNELFHLRRRSIMGSKPQMKQQIDALNAGGESGGIPPPPPVPLPDHQYNTHDVQQQRQAEQRKNQQAPPHSPARNQGTSAADGGDGGGGFDDFGSRQMGFHPAQHQPFPGYQQPHPQQHQQQIHLHPMLQQACMQEQHMFQVAREECSAHFKRAGLQMEQRHTAEMHTCVRVEMHAPNLQSQMAGLKVYQEGEKQQMTQEWTSQLRVLEGNYRMRVQTVQQTWAVEAERQRAAGVEEQEQQQRQQMLQRQQQQMQQQAQELERQWAVEAERQRAAEATRQRQLQLLFREQEQQQRQQMQQQAQRQEQQQQEQQQQKQQLRWQQQAQQQQLLMQQAQQRQQASAALATATTALETPLHPVRMEPQDEWCCPIALELMQDPYLLAGDGHTYEKVDIHAWIVQKKKAGEPLTSPKTSAELAAGGEMTFPNMALRTMIRAWIVKHHQQRFVHWWNTRTV